MNVCIERTRRYMKSDINLAQARVDRAGRDLRELQVALDNFERRHRPAFPTTEQRLSLEQAVEYVKAKHKPKSHLGESIKGILDVHGEQGFISLNSAAPHARASNGRLWNFTEAEIQRVRDHLKAFGATIVTDWSHEKGHAFQLEVSH